ncbi:MAG: type II toxin-antitoxin system RelE/ParE family toxin [bacterium]|nr:type II toxin-antitoxin system RelE/ParE family toxin [bacterium]
MSSGNKIRIHSLALRFDLPRLDSTIRQRIYKLIKQKLLTRPELYGEPLRGSLKNFWKLRAGDFRIIYSIQKDDIFIHVVGHRSEVYKIAQKRI